MAFFNSPTISYTTGLTGFVHEMVSIDLNGDGWNDLVNARFLFPLENSGVPIEVLINQKDGTFSSVSSIVTPSPGTTVHPREIVTADFNGDGKLDVFIADHGYDAAPFPGSQNRLLLSSGSAYVDATASNLPALSDFTHSAAAADIDGDRDVDIYVGNLYGQNLIEPYFLINNGTGVFTRSNTRLPSAITDFDLNRWSTSAFGDFNGDGHADLFLGRDSGASSVILLNDGDGAFSSTITLPSSPLGASSIALDSHVRDIDNDGLQDLVVVVTNAYADRDIRFWMNHGNGVFLDETADRLSGFDTTGNWLVYATFADFNGDGAGDIMTEQGGLDPSQIFINDGDGYFHAPTNGTQSFTGSAMEVGDFNNDGRPDVAAWGASNLLLYTWADGPSMPLLGDNDANSLYGDARPNTLNGYDGNDVLWSGAGDDTLLGGAHDDVLTGGSGQDVLWGGSGHDKLDGGAGIDELTGDDGNDTYIVDFAADVVVEISAGDTADRVRASVSYTLAITAYVEFLETTSATGTKSINLTGNAIDNTIIGNAGTNVLDGAAGNDVLIGGAGSDIYVLGAEATGIDTITDSSGTADRITSTITRSLANYATIERLTLAGSAAINGTGNVLNNQIIGNVSVNRLDGGAGNDTLDGAEGNDILVGRTGNDVLSGGSGHDTLTGGTGRDVITGGTGADDFNYDSSTETGKTAATRDVIKDFTRGLDDIDLSTIDANGSGAGNAAFKFLVAKGASFTGARGQLRWFQINATGTANDKTIIEADVNGDRRADFQIELTGLKALSSSDFVL